MPKRKRKAIRKGIDKHFGVPHTRTMLQLSGNSRGTGVLLGTLVDLRKGDAAVIDCIDLVWGLGAIHCVTQQWPAGSP